MTLLVDQEAFNIWLYVCNTERTIYAQTMQKIAIIPAQLSIIISGYEKVNVLSNKGSLWMRSNKGRERR